MPVKCEYALPDRRGHCNCGVLIQTPKASWITEAPRHLVESHWGPVMGVSGVQGGDVCSDGRSLFGDLPRPKWPLQPWLLSTLSYPSTHSSIHTKHCALLFVCLSVCVGVFIHKEECSYVILACLYEYVIQ